MELWRPLFDVGADAYRGQGVGAGDLELVGDLAERICYQNAKEYLDLAVEE